MIHQWIDEIIIPLTSESSAKMPQIMPITSRNDKPSNFERHFDKMGDEMENEEDGGVFVEGMFGGLLTIPLPVPEIIQSLDKTKFKNK